MITVCVYGGGWPCVYGVYGMLFYDSYLCGGGSAAGGGAYRYIFITFLLLCDYVTFYLMNFMLLLLLS